MIVLAALLLLLALGGAVFAFSGGDERSRKRMSAIANAPAPGRPARASQENAAQRRKNVTQLLKDIEKKQNEKTPRPTTRRRLEQAGLGAVSPRGFWVACGVTGALAMFFCFLTGQSLLITAMAGFVMGFGLPRWVLSFLTKRRQKKFTTYFAGAIDVIVRSVKSGLPTNEALRIVARETPDPVGSEFTLLCESLKVGVTLDQALKKMYENMPTAEVGFFGIVMTIQAKSGGNLSEALNNLAGVLRDRKRLRGKIQAMSSEAKASAMIIGSLPPGVAMIVYLTTPDYIGLLFTQRVGNLMLAACVVWMSIGIFVMRKMINFKH
jgi:tight adherence protein B